MGNPQNPMENPKNPMENPKNPMENPKNPMENPKNPMGKSPSIQVSVISGSRLTCHQGDWMRRLVGWSAVFGLEVFFATEKFTTFHHLPSNTVDGNQKSCYITS